MNSFYVILPGVGVGLNVRDTDLESVAGQFPNANIEQWRNGRIVRSIERFDEFTGEVYE